jgi:glutamyl-tRNA(Gln) amidotransferase subunit D
LTEKLRGYRGRALSTLRKAGIGIGDRISVQRGEESFEGVLIPRSGFGDDEHVVVKLKSGYNIGILLTGNTKIRRIGKAVKPSFSKPLQPKQKANLPRVSILSTGGTIASRVDYRTGGVRPALSANDLYSIVPELSNIARIDSEVLMSVFSENISSQNWVQISKRIASHIEKGVSGVVVAHGTDTMGYTAAALSFALQNLPVPVLLVGSQRSADRPSSDAATNLVGAVTAAASAPFAEVVVAMHGTVSDNSILFHRGTKVRKLHTSRRDAFKSVNTGPLAKFEDGRIEMLACDYEQRNERRKMTVRSEFSQKATLLKFHPDFNPRVIRWLVSDGTRGIVLEGTGLGHVGQSLFSEIKKAVAKNVVVAMTSQCVWGRVGMNVYDTGRDLLEMGVVPLGDILAETALVKMMWVLGQTNDAEDARSLLLVNLAHETSSRTVYQEHLGDNC